MTRAFPLRRLEVLKSWAAAPHFGQQTKGQTLRSLSNFLC